MCVCVGAESCDLPKVVGPCEGNYPSWYHEAETGECLPFRYGGCLGNNNRFASHQECDAACLAPKRVGEPLFLSLSLSLSLKNESE